MTPEPLEVAIIGAGTAGLSARSEVAKVTDSYRVFDPGPYGTTCARSACMPSKALLQSAHAFHRRHAFESLGIVGADRLSVDAGQVLAETRKLRDSLVQGVIDDMDSWRNTHLLAEAAAFRKDGTLEAGSRLFHPRATVIATGSKPVIPPGWRDRFGNRLLTSDDIFELDELPDRLAVAGLGPVGLELGQAMARLGVAVTGFEPAAIGGLDDPALQPRLQDMLASEMTVIRAAAEPCGGRNGGIILKGDHGDVEVDAILVAMGRRPDLTGLGLQAIGNALDDQGSPALEPGRLNTPGARVYFAGDAGNSPMILHEASDQGRIAGYFAARDADAEYRSRTALSIVFSDPQVALVGMSWRKVEERQDAIAIGEASFESAGRARLERRTGGALRVYAERSSARLLGASILAPGAEHLAHILAFAIDRKDDLQAVLRMPAYHPTHEEVLRKALRMALRKCDADAPALDTIRCEDAPVERSTE